MFREDYSRPFGGLVRFGDYAPRVILAPVRFRTIAVTWVRQETVNIARATDAKAHDLPTIIDRGSNEHIDGRVRWDEGVEVIHRAILEKECPWIPVWIEGCANDLAFVVNVQASALNVPWNRAEIPHMSHPFGPQEGMTGCVAREGRSTNGLTPVIDSQSNRSDPWHVSIYRPAEIAHVSDRAVFPEHGVRRNCWPGKYGIRARTRPADDLA
jgi:hypothetical protein